MKWCDRTLIRSMYDYGLCFTEKDFRDTLRAQGLDELEFGKSGLGDKGGATVSFYKCPKGQRLAIVCLGKGYEKLTIPQLYGILVHESVHIWQAIRDSMEENEPSMEFEAYSIQRISQNLIQQYENKIAKRKLKCLLKI